jgi:DNA-binding transcriptional MerR regulator
MPNLLKVREVAEMLRITPEHVRHLARTGVLPTVRLMPTGRILFDRHTIEERLRQREPVAITTEEGS